MGCLRTRCDATRLRLIRRYHLKIHQSRAFARHRQRHLTAFGAKAELDLSATGARSVEYAYTDVTADVVNVARLDAWLATADLAPGGGRVADLLVAERLYLVTASLKAAGVTSTMRDAKGAALKVDVPVVQQLVGGGVTVSGSSARTSELTSMARWP